jgi:hypothetical protein
MFRIKKGSCTGGILWKTSKFLPKIVDIRENSDHKKPRLKVTALLKWCLPDNSVIV